MPVRAWESRRSLTVPANPLGGIAARPGHHEVGKGPEVEIRPLGAGTRDGIFVFEWTVNFFGKLDEILAYMREPGVASLKLYLGESISQVGFVPDPYHVPAPGRPEGPMDWDPSLRPSTEEERVGTGRTYHIGYGIAPPDRFDALLKGIVLSCAAVATTAAPLVPVIPGGALSAGSAVQMAERGPLPAPLPGWGVSDFVPKGREILFRISGRRTSFHDGWTDIPYRVPKTETLPITLGHIAENWRSIERGDFRKTPEELREETRLTALEERGYVPKGTGRKQQSVKNHMFAEMLSALHIGSGARGKRA